MLQHRKLSNLWVPEQLTPDLEERREDVVKLLHFEAEGTGFLRRVLPGDECYLLLPAKDEASQQKVTTFFFVETKAALYSCVGGKLMIRLFSDHEVQILEYYTSRGTTMNSEEYCDLLENHRKSAIIEPRGLLTSVVLLQHDNARPRAARANCLTFYESAFVVSLTSIIFTRPPTM